MRILLVNTRVRYLNLRLRERKCLAGCGRALCERSCRDHQRSRDNDAWRRRGIIDKPEVVDDETVARLLRYVSRAIENSGTVLADCKLISVG